jgi:sigma-B regulation protein RsbU (phosphoserine phosphatase)
VTIAWETAVGDGTRLAALRSSGLIGTGPEDAFDRLIELAAELIGLPRGCITLVDAEHTTAKSAVGFPEGQPLFAPVDQSFCRFVVGSGRPLIVDDARRDPRTRDDPAIALYDAATWGGYPIGNADGVTLGTFCLMDSKPHAWTTRDVHILATLAKAASSEIALRAARAEVEAAHREADTARSAARRDRAVLGAYLDELTASDGPAASFASSLRARLEGPSPADSASADF